MRIARRTLLLGSAGTLLAGPLPAFAAANRRADGPPMPPPSDDLPQRLPVTDPSRTLLSHGWLFHDGEVETPPPADHEETYMNAKAGGARGPAAVDYDDSDWQPVQIPHDWASFQPFVKTANVSQGYRPRGIGWYRRTLRLDPADNGKKLELQFGAIATNATIWVNGSVVAHNFSGYNSIYVDLTPFARYGDDLNVIVVRVDATAMEGWWYEGAGMYRHVWLARRPAVSIATDGVHGDPRQDASGQWRVPVTVTLESIADVARPATIEARLLDPSGREVARGTAQATVQPLTRGQASLTLDAGTPQLWSVERPQLYTLVTRLVGDTATSDERRTAIGFRTVRFDANRGCFVNDRPVKLKGVCLHQDHAGVGVAIPDALLEWRLQRMKDTGVNAIRCSHNAPAPELLDYADRMGFLVMNENRQFNPAPEYLDQLEWLVRRDRNHPSVILWSVFNEEPMQGTHAGVEMVRRMAAAVHALDDSRPVTAAMNGLFYEPENVSQVVGVMGFNYYQKEYDKFHALNPTKPSTSSEDTSAFMTRGAFANDKDAHVISSYDTEAAPWGATYRDGWKLIADRPFVAGGFTWTGFDYHGEPTPYEWPTIASFFGILDLCGFAKTAYDIRRAQWIDDQPVVAIAPHWTWPGKEGQPTKLLVTSNADRVVVRLNGKTVGEAAVDRIMGNEWTVPYAPGTIEAIAYRGGREVARASHVTAGQPVALRLTPARRVMAGDGEDTQPITIDAVDAQGRHVPTANLATSFTVTGASIIGVGNGDPNSHEPEKGNARSLFNGLAQIIVQADTGRGRIAVRATAPGLKPATLTIDRLAATPRGAEPIVRATSQLTGWRRSPLTADRPDPAAPEGKGWERTSVGKPLAPDAATGWRLYRAKVTPKKIIATQGGTLRLDSVAGRGELWIDGRRVAVKSNAAPAPLTAAWPTGAGEHVVTVLLEQTAAAPAGLPGMVVVEHSAR
ncbi:beta-galactosidase [Sphingomonas jinjuensis]|uniref:Beta-galactosidase n=1 Tax=Sphingomonas jinjuensis TaxID=535907 RepID=A0A840F7J4_9SPHN|nr:beta-galactosidase GalA [Sphingomonas jinjuensis]MBB4153920.1 beta-galactosidase [Sphingomonas jinjuensis]